MKNGRKVVEIGAEKKGIPNKIGRKVSYKEISPSSWGQLEPSFFFSWKSIQNENFTF